MGFVVTHSLSGFSGLSDMVGGSSRLPPIRSNEGAMAATVVQLLLSEMRTECDLGRAMKSRGVGCDDGTEDVKFRKSSGWKRAFCGCARWLP